MIDLPWRGFPRWFGEVLRVPAAQSQVLAMIDTIHVQNVCQEGPPQTSLNKGWLMLISIMLHSSQALCNLKIKGTEWTTKRCSSHLAKKVWLWGYNLLVLFPAYGPNYRLWKLHYHLEVAITSHTYIYIYIYMHVESSEISAFTWRMMMTYHHGAH